MPQPSEIKRQDDSSSKPDASQARPSLVSRRDDKLSFLSIVSLALNCDMPQINLPRLPGIDGRSYGLGAGVSSTVARHKSGDESATICPPGTMVALKRFSATPCDNKEIKRLHRLLSQELQIFCHPFLRSHANICQMLYVGWEETKLFPVIALEMGIYGTLSSALQQIRSYNSALEKGYLTTDIIFGLEALHRCGYCHGDVKTDNVIIQSHPHRKFIAKLADFSGVKSVVTRHKDSRPDFGTPTWQPPEVILNDPDVDWQLADIYSLGMVIATIWTTEGFIPQGGTFLDTQLTYELDPRSKSLWTNIKKTKDDMHPESMITSAFNATAYTESLHLPLQELISYTLPRCPRDRATAKDISHSVATPFLMQLGNRDDEVDTIPGEDVDATARQNSRVDKNVIGSVEFSKRPKAFCDLVQQTMIKEATDILTKVKFPELQDLESEYPADEEELVMALDTLDRKHKAQLLTSEIPARFQHLAYQIFLSYTSEHHTQINEDEARKWLYWTAMARKEFAMFWYWCYEDSFQNPPPIGHAFPRRLWAVKAMLEGSDRSETLLKHISPILCAQVKSASHRLYWGRKSRQTQRFTMSWPEIQAWVRFDKVNVNAHLPVHSHEQDYGETALHYAAAIGDADFVKYLITVAGADINALNRRHEPAIFYATITGQLEMTRLLLSYDADINQVNHHGIGLVHTLTRFNDADAATLLPDLIHHGLDIYPRTSEDDIRASAEALDIPAVLPTLPIAGAAMRQQHRLFDGFLEAHKRHKLEHSDLLLLLVTLANHHLSQFLEQILLSVEEICETPKMKVGHDPGVQTESDLTPLDASSTLKKQDNKTDGLIVTHDNPLHFFQQAIYVDGLDVILRRSLHGKQASLKKRETIATLLKFGSTANIEEPSISEFARQTLRECVLSGDSIVLTTCIEVFSEKGQDLADALADHSLYGGAQALGVSINRDAYDNFVFLLDMYPFLRDTLDSNGETSLHQAARMKSTRYVERLLECGADRYVRNQTGETPFFTALISGPNLEVATLLAQDAYMDVILGRCPVKGLTVFSRLLDLMVQWKRNIDIRTLQYLVDNYGPPSAFFDRRASVTVFRYLLSAKTPYTDTEQLDKEVAIFRYIADLLKDDINSLDPFGLAPLHYAALFANPNAVEILLERKAMVNILTIESTVQDGTRDMPGHTPLAWGILRKNNGPPTHLKEGTVDVKLWQQRLDQVLERLAHESTDVGPGADLATGMRALDIAHKEPTANVAVMNFPAPPDIADKSGHAEWPKRLPQEIGPPEKSVEVLMKNGLSEYTKAKSFKIMQALLGSIDSGVRSGNMVHQLEKAPQEYLDRLQRMWSECQLENTERRLWQ